MNHIFRLIWNATFSRWQVVPEFAKRYGRPSSITRAVAHRGPGGHSGFPRKPGGLTRPPWRLKTVLCHLLALQQVMVPMWASAQGIVADGRTQTAVTTSGAVTNITTETIRGANAFNSFKSFSVDQASTANLFLPNGTANLINLVRDQRTTVEGILNSIKDGKIGGNVYFANPHGFLISKSGVVNVGSLSLSTPTPGFIDYFFVAPGNPNDAAVASLLSGTAPRNNGGVITVFGKVNAIDGVALSAGAINVAGTLYSGARFIGAAPDFTDVVNANGLASATNVITREGRIEIVADSDVTVSGTIATPGGSGVRGGDIAIRAGGDIDLQSGAIIAARGNGENSSGGTVNLWADNNAVARSGALVDASAGSSGDGGFIEFSAKNTIELAGGEFRADGTGGGKGGSVLIDPWNIVVSADILRGASGYGALPNGGTAAGANLTLLADNEITVNENVTISTRSVAGTTANDHAIGASTGASGNLTLDAGSISLKSGSKLLAGVDSGSVYSGGDVLLKATRNWTGEAKISVDNATITGRNVALTANATYNDSILTSWLPVIVPVTVATIDVNSGIINASGTLNLAATSLINARSDGFLPLGSIVAVSAASVDVHGASVLTAGGNTTLASSSTVTSNATPGGPNPTTLPGDAGVAINVVVSTAKTRVGDTSSVTVSGGTLDLTAKNAVTATTTADATAGGAVAIGGTLALSEITSVTQAVIDGSATTSSSALAVEAESTSVVTTSAKAANKGAKKQTEAEKTAAPSETEKALDKYKDQTSTSDGSVDVAAAVAIANVNNITLAEIASTGTQTSAGAATVSSKASSSSTVAADGSSAGGTVGVGAAVGVNIGVLVNQARVADNASVSSGGLTVRAVMPTADGKNSFVTTATSGAGASNVGVAGALGTNVLVNATVATIEGNKDGIGSGAAVNASGGDVAVEAANASESKVTVGASVKPASGTEPAAVGVGASVGMNVGVSTTVAEIGNGAGISNAKDLGLTAKGAHTLENAVTGGAAGANVSVTPVAAITVAVNTTTARLGTGGLLNLSGAFTGSAEQTSSSTSTATGQTQGNNVAVGASIALNSATDTVLAEIDRDVTATDGVEVNASSSAKSSASATASVAGGEKAKDDGSAPAPGGGAGSGKSVDEKVAAQGDAAKAVGKNTAASAPAEASAATTDTATKLDGTQEAPKTEDNTESGGVSVAAAVGVSTGIATTVAKVGKARTITSSGGALKVTSANETDTSAKADGSQVDSGNTSVGVGAAVALNAGISTNVAVVGDDAVVNTKGLTISAVNVAGQKSDAVAEAKSGAGAGNVGVAGSLAASVAINTTVAALEGDIDNDGTGATVNANDGDILIEAANATTNTVKSGAEVKGTGGTAKVGVGASIGVNVGVNTTVAEVADKAVLTGGKDLGLNATADHTLTTDVTGGASGAKVAVTPLVAATIAVNTTTARLGKAKKDGSGNDIGLGISGKYSSTADHKGSATTTATGQTQGNSVAVGASIGLTVATDTVVAEIDRDVTATDGVEVNAKSVAKSSTSATASVAGGEKAKDDGTAPAPGGGSGSGKSVDEKVADQQTKATEAGKKTADKAPAATTPAAGDSASDKLDDTKDKQPPPSGETSEGGVAVAAAVGVNVGVATTVAKVGKGRKITSSGGALKVTSANETDTSAKADGSQVDSGNTDVGVGAAVALNVGVATTTAVVADEAIVRTQGLTISATGISGEKSDSVAEAKSGAGAGNVGVAGALAINAAVNTTVALLEGDVDGDNIVADVDAGGGAVLIEAQNATTSTAKVSADVKGTDDKAKVGVGASVGVNVAVNTTVAEVADKTKLTNAGSVGLNATANHAMTTEATGGAAGAKVSVTPVVAASIAVNTTVARLGDGTTALDVNGAYSSKAEQTSTVTTKATGQAQGDVAVGASLGATIAVDNVHATVERNLDAGNGVELAAKSDTSLTTEVKAGAKGAKAAKKDEDGKETPEAGTTVDEQKSTQLDFAKSRNSKAAGVNTTTPEAKTPDTTEQAPGTDKPTNPPNNEKEGKKVSVAAAIGATVAYNQAKAEIAAGKTVGAGTGKLKVAATTDTNYRTLATGEAVSDDVGVAAAVALTGTYNKTQANIGSGATISDASDVEISATSRQNRGADFQKTMSAEAVSGAGGGEVAVAGSLALVGNWNETRASIDEGVTMGTVGAPVGDVTVESEETGKVAAQARAGALSTGDKSKAGVGASFAVLLSYNQNTAAVGYDANKNGSYAPTSLFVDSLSVTATKNRVWFLVPTLADAKNFVVNDIKALNFDALDPSTYLGSNNYYTEAVAGAAAKGNAAVAGAFAVNIFGNTTEAYLGESVGVTATGKQPAGEQLGVEVAARSDTQAVSFVGGVAGAKKAGVGIAATSIVNLDQTLATIGKNSVVKSNADGAGIKVSAQSRQDIANIGVAGGLATQGAGVGGVLGAIVSLAKTEAKIGDNAEVKSQGDVDVEATGDITAVSVAGGVAGGKSAGVGASIAGNVLANLTRAEIGDNAKVAAKKDMNVAADADQVAVTAVVAGAGGGKAGVAGALSANVIVGSTEALVGKDAQINTDAAYDGGAQNVAVTARDDTVVVGIAGGGAGGGKAGVGAALDTTVLVKGVKAHVGDNARINADRNVVIDARASEALVSVALGFGGGGSVGVGGAVSVVVNKNDVQAGTGAATIDSNGNVLINAEDDITAVLTAGAGAGGGNTGVGASLAVGTLLGSTRAYVGENAVVNARGNAAAADVYVGETVIAVQSETPVDPGNLLAKKTESAKGLSVTAYNRENLISTVVGGAGGGTAGVAATVSANVIANTTEASIGRGAKINEINTAASAEQQVRVKAIDETLLVNTAGAGAGGGSAGVGAAANVGVVAKTTQAWIGRGALVNAKQAVELDAASSALTFSTTAGFAGGGSAGVGGAVAGVGVANTTMAYIEDGTSTANAAKINVSGGDLRLNASDLATSWLVTGAGAGGGAAGVGGSLSVGVNASTTKAKIGDYAETNASGTTEVHADSTENVNTITIAGAGGGSAGVAGSISANVVVSKTEAGIGDYAKVNQTLAGQNVDVKATDRIITVGAAGAGAGGGAAGVGGSAVATVVLNTTSAYIGSGAKVAATQDIKVAASSEKYVNSAAVAGAGGGAAGVAGAVSVISVGSLLDGEAKSGLQTQDEDGNAVTTQSQADGQTTKSAVGNTDENMLGSSSQSTETRGVLDSKAGKLAVSQHMADTATVPLKNTQAFIGYNATVKAGRDVTVSAKDTTLAINANGAGAGGGAAGVAGSLGVTLLHDSAEAFIANGAKVDADRTLSVKAETGETVVNLGVTGYGGGAAGVGGSAAVNVVTSNTSAYIGAADINQEATTSTERSVEVKADSNSNLIAVSGSGGGAGAAAVGGVLNVNTLAKNTKAFIGEGAAVKADENVIVSAASAQNIVAAGISIQGAGAAAVGGAATVNVVANTTEAFIGSARDDNTKTAAVVDSDGNVVVAAADDTLVVAVAGSGTGAGAAAVGGAVGANVISSQTRAYVGDNTAINARGNAAGASVDSGTVGAAGMMPSLPSGVSGDIDADRNGTKDGDVSSGASFTIAGGGASTGVNPSTVKDSEGNSVGSATGGLGARNKETVTGLSVTASGNQKIVSAAMGVAGAGAAGVTGTATADVIVSQTEASIGDGALINQSGAAGTGHDVRVRAADNSLIVMASGTIAGAGAAAVSGSANTAVIAKQTKATIGDADVKARDVAVEAAGREDVYVVTVNASVAGAAGVGAAAGVGVIANQTQAGIKAGATVDASRDIKVKAEQDSSLDIYTVSGAGGIVGVSGAFSVGVIDNTTRAYVEGGTAPKHATLDAGRKTEVSATSKEKITTATVSAAGGGVGVAGAVGVKVVTSETTAEIGDYTKVNQTRRGGAAQDVKVAATDSVKLKGGSGAGGFGAYGAGATADVNVVRNTTTASIGNHAKVRADNDIGVAATSVKDVQSAAVAAAGGASAGIAGAVALAFVGASIQSDSDAKSGIGNGATAAKADEKMKADNVGSQLGSSEHVQGTRSELAARSAAQGVSGELNDASTTSRDKTRAFVGSNAQIVAGGKVEVSATDRTQLDLLAVGAAGGAVGIGAAVGVGITHSTTEAFVDASSTIDANGDVTVAANALNVNANGSKVESWAGAGGVVGLSASVAVLKDTSTTRSYLGNNVDVVDAARLAVVASTDRKATTVTYGASVGIAAIGASVAVASFKGATTAMLGAGVQVDADAVEVSASDDSVASAHSRAGSAGIVAGSGSVATAEVTSTVTAEVGNAADIDATGDVDILATSRAATKADAVGVNVGAGAVGASVATATSGAKVYANVGENASITGASFDLIAKRAIKGGAPTAQAHALGAAGGLLLGANGSIATAQSTGETVSAVGTGSTITTSGTAAVKAESASLQSASSFGVTTGLLSLGANFSHATSDSLTQASLGDNVAVSGGGLQVSATGNDGNYSLAMAGAGGLLTLPYSAAYTENTSRTYATTGSGDATRKVDVGSFYLGATQTSNFDSWIENISASLVGVSGAKAKNTVNVDTQALLGTSAWVEADDVTMQAGNTINKTSPGAKIPGTAYNTPGWNVVSSSGGLADVPAAESATTIVADALLQVGAGAHLEQSGTSGDMRLDAWNNLAVTDKVKMASGGLVSAASAKSSIMADVPAGGSSPAIVNRADASVVVAPTAQLISDGDMALGARTRADLHSQAAVDVFGLVGVAPEGTSIARFKGTNTVEIGAGAKLSSASDVRLSAGSDTADTQNDLSVVARTDVFNNTAIPVNRDPVADAVIDAHSQINLKAGSRINAAGDVMLYADEGRTAASGVGIGKDIYREALAAIASAISNAFGGGDVSFETRTGSSVRRVSSDVAINGEVHVGTNRQQQLVVGLDGTVTYRKGDIDIIATDFRDVASDIQARIRELDVLIAKYDVNTPDASVAVAAYRSEKAFLQRKLKDLGFPDGQVAASPNPDFTPLKAAEDAVAGMTTLRSTYDTTKTTLTTQNTNLANDNTTLTNSNNTLTSNNTTLTNNNNTLNTVTIPALIAARAALDPDSSTYTADYNNLTSQISTAQNTVTGNTATISSNSTTIGNNNTTIAGNNSTIAANNTQITDLTTKITSLDTQIGIVNTGIANGGYPNTALSGPASKFLTVSDASARLGNIYLRGDRVHGTGTLDAPGDAAITIDNYGPNFLLLRNLSIPADVGGKIYQNGVDVKDNTGINHLNGAAGGAAFNITTAESSGAPAPAITIRSHYDPLSDTPPANTPNVAPDLVFQGDISNPRGSVKIQSEAGSIRLEQKRDANGVLLDPVETASIRANDVEIVTRNGDFVQSYTNTFFHTAGAPLTVTPGNPNLPESNPARFSSIARTPEQSGKGIVANGSVLIAARYLNINGIIQSGIAEWGVNVPADAAVSIPGNATASFAQAMAYYNALSDADKAKPNAALFEVGGATVSGLSAPEQGKWEQIRVRFNAKEDRLELGGVQVQGGYIELFGQIFNTNMHESTGLSDLAGGQLRVLDGYGKINVSNLTSKALWINTLDTGRGAKGEINISNIVGFDVEGRALVATETYTRDPGDARSGSFYTPTTGLRYAAQVGKETGWTDNYRYSSGAIIGIETFPAQLDQYWISRVYSNNVAIPNNGEFLGTLGAAHTGEYQRVNQTQTTSSAPKQTASWFECNWWTLCAYGTYYKEFEITSLAKTITTDSLKADNRIAIKFIGFDNGAVNVSSTGDVVINGAISNRNGNTAVASAGSILQGKDVAVVGGSNIQLAAGTGIGSTSAPLQVNTGDLGRLDAASASGDVRIRETLGDLRIGVVGGANVANVLLEADRSLVNADAASYVQGRRVELASDNGGIGDIAGDPLTVRTAYSADTSQWPAYGLKATARDSINIRNEADTANPATYSGNLLLISAESKAGDVRIETTGSVIDNNPFATTDTRTEAELAALWDDLRLRGDPSVAKANETVAAYKAGKNANYALYWKMRSSQADGGAIYSPDYRLTDAERTALATSGMTTAQIDQFELNRRAQYQQLHAEVGGFTATYVAGYDYAMSATEEAQLRKGATWSDAQLALSVGAGLLKNITDTVTTIKQPNAKGRSVTLIASSNIGSYDAPQEIDLTAGLSALTTAQKAALAAAERGDATFDDPVNPTRIVIVQPRPVNVEVGAGRLVASAASGYALLGSEQDLRIDRVSAASNVRIKTAGSLINAASVAGAVNVSGVNVILEAATGGIGSLPDADGNVAVPLRLDAAGDVIFRASGDIWIEAQHDLRVDTVYSPKDVRLDANGSILDAHVGESDVTPEINVRARNIDITAATGGVGDPFNSLDVGVNSDGFVTASAVTVGQGVYLNSPAGEHLNIGSVISGDAVSLSSAVDMTIDGQVSGPGPFTLAAGGAMTLTPHADIHATTLGVFLRANSLEMQDAQRMLDDGEPLDPKYVAGDAARMRVDAGTIDIETVGDAKITGIETGNPTASAIRVVSTAGRILDNGDTRLDIIADTPPAATLTIFGALGVGNDPLDVRLLNLQATSGGVVDIAVQDSVNIIGITAGDRVLLTAGGDITGHSVTSTGTGGINPDKGVSITSTGGGVNLASVSGTAGVAIAGQGGVSVGAVNVGTHLTLAGPQVSAVVHGGPGSVGGSVTGYAGSIADHVSLTLSGSGGFAFNSFWTSTASVLLPLGPLSIDNTLISDRATFQNPLTMLLVDQHNRSLQSADVQLYSAGAPFRLGLSGNHVSTDAFVIHRSPLHEVITPSGSNTSVVESGEDALARTAGAKREQEREETGDADAQLITYAGIPVLMNEECDPNRDEDCAK